MERKSTGRYSIGSITSKDETLISRYEELRKTGATHESIYIAGLEALERKNA